MRRRLAGGIWRGRFVDQVDKFGVAALGVQGIFTVEVLEGPPDRWWLCIDSPVWCFNFELARPAGVRQLSEFLGKHLDQAGFAELAIGSFHGAVVWMVKDDEFPDRFFLRAGGGGPLVEFTLAGEDIRAFVGAVSQTVEDLETPG